MKEQPLQTAFKVNMNNKMTSITNLQEKPERKYCNEMHPSSAITSKTSPQTISLQVKPHL